METHYDETAPASHDTLPPGTYTARAISWAWDTDKNGDPCIKIMFALSDGRPGYQLDGTLYLDESKPDAKGRTALDRGMEALRAMGLDGDLTAELDGIDRGDVSLVTDINAKGYARVRFVNAPRAARELRTFAPPAAPELNGFLAKLNAKSRALSARAQASGTRPAAQQPDGHPQIARAAGQHHGADLGRGVVAPLGLDPGVTVGGLDDLVGGQLDLLGDLGGLDCQLSRGGAEVGLGLEVAGGLAIGPAAEPEEQRSGDRAADQGKDGELDVAEVDLGGVQAVRHFVQQADIIKLSSEISTPDDPDVVRSSRMPHLSMNGSNVSSNQANIGVRH